LTVLELDPEDRKLVTLARAARARTQAAEGAAVRDTDGRTYAASTVDQPSFQLTAVQAAIAAAVSSGAEGIEAAALVSGEPLVQESSVNAVRDLSQAAPIYRADPAGDVHDVLT
jgi:cytidine deaminase